MYSVTRRTYSQDFFTKSDARTYFADSHSKMRAEVEQMTDTEILSCNFQELADYLAKRYHIFPIIIFETNIERTLSETKVKKTNPFRGYPYEKDFYEIDGVCVTFKIPFDGNPDLFEIKPSSYILSHFSTQSFIRLRKFHAGF